MKLLSTDRTFIAGSNLSPCKVTNLGTFTFAAGPPIVPPPMREEENKVNFDDWKAAPRTVERDGEPLSFAEIGSYEETRTSFAKKFPKSEWLAYSWVEGKIE